MSKESFVFLLGLVVVIVPFLGIPGDWKRIVFVVCGALIMLVGYILRRNAFIRSIETKDGERRSEAFAESNPEDVHDSLFTKQPPRV